MKKSVVVLRESPLGKVREQEMHPCSLAMLEINLPQEEFLKLSFFFELSDV